MLYREAGQFKTTYAADQQLFPIRQDGIGMAILLAAVFVGVPLAAATPAIASAIDFNYWFSGVLIPFLIFSLAALGLNILTGYAGQLSLGTAAFMAVGAFAAYNFELRVPGMPMLLSFVLAGIVAALIGIVFGLPISAATIPARDRKSTRLNSSHSQISYAVFCLKKKKKTDTTTCALRGD